MDAENIVCLIRSMSNAGYSITEANALLKSIQAQDVTAWLMAPDDAPESPFWLIETNPPVTIEDIQAAAMANPNGSSIIMDMNWTLDSWIARYRAQNVQN